METNVLGMMVDRAKEVGLVDGFVMGRDMVSLSHLQCADDSIFFFPFGDET